ARDVPRPATTRRPVSRCATRRPSSSPAQASRGMPRVQAGSPHRRAQAVARARQAAARAVCRAPAGALRGPLGARACRTRRRRSRSARPLRRRQRRHGRAPARVARRRAPARRRNSRDSTRGPQPHPSRSHGRRRESRSSRSPRRTRRAMQPRRRRPHCRHPRGSRFQRPPSLGALLQLPVSLRPVLITGAPGTLQDRDRRRADPAHPQRDGAVIRAHLGVVPQLDTLDFEVTVWENVIIYGRYFGLSRKELRRRADELLEFVQLDERADSRVEPLSGGMKRRLTIARSLVNDPDLLLLDEPTTGLDPQARHLVWDRLFRLRQRGATIVLTTHYMDEAEQLCDRLVVMDKAKIVASGSPRNLIDRYSTREVL